MKYIIYCGMAAVKTTKVGYKAASYSGASSLGHLYSRDTKYGPGKVFTKSLYLLPLLKKHLYSGERGTFSGPRHLGLTSIQGTP